MEQFQGKARKRREPPPNPDVIFTSTNQKQQEQQIQRSDTTSKKSFASVVKGNQKDHHLQRAKKSPLVIQMQVNNKCPQSRNRTGRAKKSCWVAAPYRTIKYADSMMFAAIKALLCANPSLKDIPEVQAVLAFEPLVTTSPTAQRRGSSE
ncbi:hypothetical protein HPB52_019720 [Rhipicephalus sanguineus]|uniref:Uncharacterized protein n=1 Tax=Rhipicephalus sanguineus TaxID=34632 RepID=A0A9D4PXH4_RHISA|nr:hypothetical protein HPB52_019720 [Rhipicephalus sanguineus]